MLAKLSESRKPPNIRKEFIEANEETVKALAQVGATTEEISAAIGISEASLEKHFKKVLKVGRANLHITLRKSQVQSAVIDRNPSLLVWLGKNYLKQREPKQEVEHSGGIVIEKVMFNGDEPKD